MNSNSSKPQLPRLDPQKVQQVYEEHAAALERFLIGVLRNSAAAADALQTTFTRLLEKGHLVEQQDSIKAWLFRVAFNEAMLIRRRDSISRKHAEGIAWKIQMQAAANLGTDNHDSQSIRLAIRKENAEKIHLALLELPKQQREVVEKRIYNDLKFREISEELNVPLGTVLARMQAGLKKLKPILNNIHDD